MSLVMRVYVRGHQCPFKTTVVNSSTTVGHLMTTMRSKLRLSSTTECSLWWKGVDAEEEPLDVHSQPLLSVLGDDPKDGNLTFVVKRSDDEDDDDDRMNDCGSASPMTNEQQRLREDLESAKLVLEKKSADIETAHVRNAQLEEQVSQRCAEVTQLRAELAQSMKDAEESQRSKEKEIVVLQSRVALLEKRVQHMCPKEGEDELHSLRDLLRVKEDEFLQKQRTLEHRLSEAHEANHALEQQLADMKRRLAVNSSPHFMAPPHTGVGSGGGGVGGGGDLFALQRKHSETQLALARTKQELRAKTTQLEHMMLEWKRLEGERAAQMEELRLRVARWEGSTDQQRTAPLLAHEGRMQQGEEEEEEDDDDDAVGTGACGMGRVTVPETCAIQ